MMCMPSPATNALTEQRWVYSKIPFQRKYCKTQKSQVGRQLRMEDSGSEFEEGGDPLVCMEEGTAEATPEGGVVENLANQKQTTKECPICYEAKVCTPLENCNHFFCEECLRSHVRHCIRDVPIPCPNAAEAPACTKSISTAEIQVMLPARDFCEYQKTVRIHSDPTLITCPSCDKLTLPNNEKESRFVTCSECMHEFCDLHGNAHELTVKACKEMTGQDRKSKRTIRRHTKPCSTCRVPIEKNGGCNRIKCTACNTFMCWTCGTHTRMQRGRCKCEVKYDVALVFCVICFIFLVCVCATVYAMIGIAVFIVSAGCCFGCCCGRPLSERAYKPSLHGPGLGLWVASFWVVLPWVMILENVFDAGTYYSPEAEYVFG